MVTAFMAIFHCEPTMRIVGLCTTARAADRLGRLFACDLFKRLHGHQPDADELEDFMLDKRIFVAEVPMDTRIGLDLDTGLTFPFAKFETNDVTLP